MYCASCGKQIANNSVYCGYCGKPVPRGDTFAELVAAARTGSQDAIGALYEKTYSKVYFTVKSMIRDEDAVLDIVQDTYIKAFAHLDSFQGDVKFLPWVRQIAANTARDWLKRKRPMLFSELDSDDGQDTPVEELLPDERSENLPDQVIDQKETKRLLREIIEDLPEDQRAVIGMFYYEEMSVKEIAAAMDVTESAVKSRLMYGRNKIEKKVRELEKQGTKLYSLSPLPFLLLLFRNLDTYATQAPDVRILHSLLALQPVKAVAAGAAQGVNAAGAAGAAQGAGMAGTATGAGAAGTAGAGAAAAAGGLGAWKIGLLVLAAVTVVGFGAFGAMQITSRFAGSQEQSATEDAIDQEESEGREESRAWNESDAREESKVREESEESEKSDPIDEALEQYRIIISQADSYDYGEIHPYGFEVAGYRYALVQMQPDDPVPTLLVERGERDSASYTSGPSQFTARIFRYDPDTKMVCQPAKMVGEGGPRSTPLSMAGDGNGMMIAWWEASWEGSVTRYTLDGDSIISDIVWRGRIDLMPDSITFIDIEWHEIGDLSALDSWAAPDSGEEKTESGEKPKEPEKPAPINEALEQYRIIISQADSYEFGETHRGYKLAGYRYALVQMQPDDPVPTLLLERGETDSDRRLSTDPFTVRIFQYDPDTETVRQPAETLRVGYDPLELGCLQMAGDGDGMIAMGYTIGYEGETIIRYTLDGDSLISDIVWSGESDWDPSLITVFNIEWHEIGDLSALNSWEKPDLDEIPKDRF